MRFTASPESVSVDAWGPGATTGLERAPGLAGLLDDRESFDPSASEVVSGLAHRNPGLRLGRTSSLTDVLLPTILGQKVTVVEAADSYRKLSYAFGEAAPGPAGEHGLKTSPVPERLAGLSYSDLHRFGVERKRADIFLMVARKSAHIEALLSKPPLSAAAVLQQFPGIGPWTASIARLVGFGDPDAVVIGDYHIPSIVAWNLAGERKATDDRMLELLAPFAGHRGRVVALLKTQGAKPPRRAPKRELRSFSEW